MNKTLVALGYVATIVVANLAVARFGLIPIAPGLVAPAGVVVSLPAQPSLFDQGDAA